jgi:hypothetical protein
MPVSFRSRSPLSTLAQRGVEDFSIITLAGESNQTLNPSRPAGCRSAPPQLHSLAVTTHSVPIIPPGMQRERRLLTL